MWYYYYRDDYKNPWWWCYVYFLPKSVVKKTSMEIGGLSNPSKRNAHVFAQNSDTSIEDVFAAAFFAFSTNVKRSNVDVLSWGKIFGLYAIFMRLEQNTLWRTIFLNPISLLHMPAVQTNCPWPEAWITKKLANCLSFAPTAIPNERGCWSSETWGRITRCCWCCSRPRGSSTCSESGGRKMWGSSVELNWFPYYAL